MSSIVENLNSIERRRLRLFTLFITCFFLMQIYLLFSRTLTITMESTESPMADMTTETSSQRARERVKGHFPDVSHISLKHLAELDQLSEYIVQIEADRVFAKTRVGHIQGTRWRGGQDEDGTLAIEQVKLIREQIHCWTQHGAWVREDGRSHQSGQQIKSGNAREEIPWAARKHRGDARFGQCDINLMASLDNDAQKEERLQSLKGNFYLGDFDSMHDRYIVREAVKWRWVPDESICGPLETSRGNQTASPTPTTPLHLGFGDDRSIYQSFNKEKFCESLQDRNILVVGDVTQYQLHDVILSATETEFTCHGEMGCLHRRPHPLCSQYQDIDAQDKTEVAGELVRAPYLKFVRNDIISIPWAVNPEAEELPLGSTVEQPWATPEMIDEYKIVLLNRGLFWRSDDEFLMELVFTIKHIWKFYSGTMIIYRATHPVFNCTVLKEQNEDGALAGPDGLSSIFEGTLLQQPLTTTPRRGQGAHSKASTTQSTGFRPTLADVQRQNRMAKVIVEAAGGIFLDTEDMFSKRPDGRMGHGDCARFCAPGPLDAYADLLYNTLRILV